VNGTCKLLLLVSLTCMPAGATAQEVRRVSMGEALQLFAANNLEIRLARSRRAEAAGVARQSRAYPNPTSSFTREFLSRDGDDYSETYLNFSQPIELPFERSARVAVADRSLEAADAELRADSVRLAFTVKRSFVQATVAEDLLVLAERVMAVFRQAASSAANREAEGDISRYDLMRIRVERSRYENLLADAELDLSSERRRLALLILPDGDQDRVAPTGGLSRSPPELQLDRIAVGAVSRRQEVAAARAEVAAAAAGLRLSRAARLPDVTAMGGLKRQSDSFDGAFFGLSIPLPLFNRNSGTVEIASVRVGAADSRLALIERQVEMDQRLAIETYGSLRDRTAFFGEDQVGDGLDLLEIAQVAYESGEMELLDLMDAAEALWNARTAELRLIAGLWTAYYDLERALAGLDAEPSSGSTERENEQ